MTTRILAFGFFLSVVMLPSLCFAQSKVQIEKEQLLKLCEQHFGPPLDKNLILYEASAFYVLHVVFDKKNMLEKLAVVPKYDFDESHPEWEGSETFEYLSWTQYQDLLTRVDLIKPKGELIKPPPSISFVTNRTAWVTTGYKNAVLTVGYLATLDQDENSTAEIKWFRVEFGKKAEKQDSTIKLNTKAVDELLKTKKPEAKD